MSLALAAVVLSGCQSLYNAPKDFDPKESAGLGLVVLSSRLDDKNCSVGAGIVSSVALRSEETGEKTSLVLHSTFWQPEFSDPPGSILAYALKPGYYVMGQLHMAKFTSVHPLGLGFTVREGQVVYLGEFATKVLDCKRFAFNLSDQWNRDGPAIKNRYPKINLNDVNIRILQNSLMPVKRP